MKTGLVLAALVAAAPARAGEHDPTNCFGADRYQAASSCADDSKLPPGVTCEFVRVKVAQYGRAASRAWALLHGYSRRQLREAEKCLQ